MSTPTGDPLVDLIPVEIGDPNGTIEANLQALYDAYADKSEVPRLRYQYVKRHAINLLLGPQWAKVSYEQVGYLRESLSDAARALFEMRKGAQDEIDKAEDTAARTAVPISGDLITQAPESAPSGWPGLDANDPAFRGNPYRRGRLRGR
jgi:hypothetical protein